MLHNNSSVSIVLYLIRCWRVVLTSELQISYSGKLCNKNCIINRSKTSIIWSTFCYTAGSDKR